MQDVRKIMRYAITLGIMSLALRAGSALYPSARWILIWAGVSFGAVEPGYACTGPRVFGKTLSRRFPLAPTAEFEEPVNRSRCVVQGEVVCLEADESRRSFRACQPTD